MKTKTYNINDIQVYRKQPKDSPVGPEGSKSGKSKPPTLKDILDKDIHVPGLDSHLGKDDEVEVTDLPEKYKGNPQYTRKSKEEREKSQSQINSDVEEIAARIEREEEERLKESGIGRSNDSGSGSSRFNRKYTPLKIDWQGVLYRMMDKTPKIEELRNRPDTRYIGSYIYEPSYREVGEEDLLRTVIAVDTSGSVGSDVLNIFLSEIYKIAMQLSQVVLTVLFFDTRVYAHIEIDTTEEFSSNNKHIKDSNVLFQLVSDKKKLKSLLFGALDIKWGGTNISNVTNYIKSQRMEPLDGFLVFTDGGVEDSPKVPTANEKIALICADSYSLKSGIEKLSPLMKVYTADVPHS